MFLPGRKFQKLETPPSKILRQSIPNEEDVVLVSTVTACITSEPGNADELARLKRELLEKNMIIGQLESENAQLNKKCEHVKKVNNKMLLHLADYQKKIWEYEKKLKLKMSTEQIEDTLENKCGENEEISGYFTAEDMTKLNSIELLKKGDRSFVGEVLKILYRDNISALNNRTLHKTTTGKKTMTLNFSKTKTLTGLYMYIFQKCCVYDNNKIAYERKVPFSLV